MQSASIKTFLILTLSGLIFFVNFCRGEPENKLIGLFPIENYDQKLTDWIKPTDPAYDKTLLNAEQQKIFTEEFYRHYFSTDTTALSPWNPTYITKIISMSAPDDIFSLENKIIDFYDNRKQTENDHIGYGSNFRPYDGNWIEAIKKNINVSQFTRELVYDAAHRGIAIDNLYARMLPTDDVHFYSHTLAGQGYPFDNLQASVLWAGSPVYIIGETLDHKWFLVLTPDYYIAWVKSIGIALVDHHFIEKWQAKAHHQLVAITHTQIPIVDIEKGIYRFSGYVGMIFPEDKKDEKGLNILIPVANEQRQAKIHHALLATQNAALVPLASTPHHFDDVMSQLLNRPYGWGGMYFYNDCSAELKSLYAIFGIWLPRHSTYQVDAEKVPGTSVDLSAIQGAEQRINALEKSGHGFMTIVYVGGHVFMYLGNYPNPRDPVHIVALTYQNIWGLSPRPANRRSIIGGAVLFPLMASYPEDPELISLAGHQLFQTINLDEPQEIQTFKKRAIKIDMHALLWP